MTIRVAQEDLQGAVWPRARSVDGDAVAREVDFLLSLTAAPNPIFTGSVGVLDATGSATATLHVPPLAFLSGLTIYSAALTIDQPAFPVARTVMSAPVSITIQ